MLLVNFVNVSVAFYPEGAYPEVVFYKPFYPALSWETVGVEAF